MATPIYKLFMGTPKPHWYHLSKDEQEKLLAKVDTLLNQVGAKRIMMCNSGWSSEKWAFFGLEEFPNVEAVQRHSQLLAELNFPFQFLETFSILGKLVPTETTQFIFLAHSLVRFKYSFFLHQIQCSSHFRPQLFSVVLNCNDHRRK